LEGLPPIIIDLSDEVEVREELQEDVVLESLIWNREELLLVDNDNGRMDNIMMMLCPGLLNHLIPIKDVTFVEDLEGEVAEVMLVMAEAVALVVVI